MLLLMYMNSYKNRTSHLQDLVIDGRIILKCIAKQEYKTRCLLSATRNEVNSVRQGAKKIITTYFQ